VIAIGLFSYVDLMNKKAFAGIPQRNDIVAEMASGKMAWETAYLLAQPPVDPDAYLYVGEGCIKGK